jgi:hypothetical protein
MKDYYGDPLRDTWSLDINGKHNKTRTVQAPIQRFDAKDKNSRVFKSDGKFSNLMHLSPEIDQDGLEVRPEVDLSREEAKRSKLEEAYSRAINIRFRGAFDLDFNKYSGREMIKMYHLNAGDMLLNSNDYNKGYYIVVSQDQILHVEGL